MKLGESRRSLGCELHGDSNIEITGVAGIEDAKAGGLTFLANPKYRPLLATTQASAVIVTKDTDAAKVAMLHSANPQLDFARAIELFHAAPGYAPGIHPTAVIAKSARVAVGAHVGPYCFIADDAETGWNAVPPGFWLIYR